MKPLLFNLFQFRKENIKLPNTTFSKYDAPMLANLNNKKIILGVTGSIAAYKAAILIRLLVKAGAEVKVVMTSSAKDFITPLTLSTLSKNPVYTDFYNIESGEWANHVELGIWADIILIAPATANEIGKLANGLCDNLLTAVYLSAKCPVVLAPAMDLDMYKHPSLTANLLKLKEYGNLIIEAESGELASGLTGQGRMAEPENIVNFLNAYFEVGQQLKGKKVLLTAGPTQELIDPVRFISNHSSGKMGYAIAAELVKKGAKVHLISGPTSFSGNDYPFTVHKVKSAEEMYRQCANLFPEIDIAIFAAAVADYRPRQVEENKIKKNDASFTIELVKNIDIAAEFGKIKRADQLSVGFALETDQEFANAKQKLEKKNFDMVILNSMKDEKATFGYDTNKITIIRKSGQVLDFGLKSKQEVAADIVNEIIHYEL